MYKVKKTGKHSYAVVNRFNGHMKGKEHTTHAEAQRTADRLNKMAERSAHHELRAMAAEEGEGR